MMGSKGEGKLWQVFVSKVFVNVECVEIDGTENKLFNNSPFERGICYVFVANQICIWMEWKNFGKFNTKSDL